MDPSYALGSRQHEIKVYRWGFPCLDYSFDVLVSWSRDLNSYDWFCLPCHIACAGFTSDVRFYEYYRINCSCPALPLVPTCLLFTFLSCLECSRIVSETIQIRFARPRLYLVYRFTYAYPCSPLGFCFTTRLGSFIWLPWILMSRSWSLELASARNLWILPVADQSGAAEAWIPGRSFRALSFQAPVCLSSFPFVNSWVPFYYRLLMYILVFSQLRHSGDEILL